MIASSCREVEHGVPHMAGSSDFRPQGRMDLASHQIDLSTNVVKAARAH